MSYFKNIFVLQNYDDYRSIFLKILLIYIALLIVMGGYAFCLWVVLIIYFINIEAADRLKVYYIRSKFFPGELTLLEYNILTIFYVLGAVTKVKGVVTKEDIQYAEGLMLQFRIQPNSEDKMIVINSFNQGKEYLHDLSRVVAEFYSFFENDIRAKSYFFDYQLAVALKEGQLLDEELVVLAVIARELDMSDYSFNQKIKSAQAAYHFKQRFRNQNDREHFQQNQYYDKQYYQNNFRHKHRHRRRAYGLVKRNEFDILGVKEHDDYITVKKAYRLLIREYHPDKFSSGNVPLAVLNETKEKSQEIIAAYDLICKLKGWK